MNFGNNLHRSDQGYGKHEGFFFCNYFEHFFSDFKVYSMIGVAETMQEM